VGRQTPEASMTADGQLKALLATIGQEERRGNGRDRWMEVGGWTRTSAAPRLERGDVGDEGQRFRG